MMADARRPLLSIVIPAYNECRTIAEVLRRVQAAAVEKEIIVVDDGSTDGTREFLQTLASDAVRVLFQERNRGKGAALRRGFQEARGAVVLVQDADLEYDPQDYPALLAPILEGTADVVYGSRVLNVRRLSTRQYLGNRALTLLSNLFTHLGLSDVYVGYKVFRRVVLEQINLREDRFGFEVEITARVARGRWRLREVPISYHPRTYVQGKKITWRDALAGAWCIMRYGLGRPQESRARIEESTDAASAARSDC
jgi:glycosyltransferase involved in cell wall biosynthesis